ncbi:hypothetical protein J6590_014248 [Homalodisca vitripennis]|nr:hypothetical protein J6590_014248 [Homalodisca vitripennis]
MMSEDEVTNSTLRIVAEEVTLQTRGRLLDYQFVIGFTKEVKHRAGQRVTVTSLQNMIGCQAVSVTGAWSNVDVDLVRNTYIFSALPHCVESYTGYALHWYNLRGVGSLSTPFHTSPYARLLLLWRNGKADIN